jgi:mono/diheme cytochrome c family protein
MIAFKSTPIRKISSFFKSTTTAGTSSSLKSTTTLTNLGAPSFAPLRRVGGTNAALLFFVLVLSIPALVLAEADGKWLHRVPDEDHARHSPYTGQQQAAEAGKVIFAENCAKCHGADANGRRNRPSLRSERIRHATDGDLSWMLRNGNPYKGMPSWSSLPEQQRWQIIAYLRTLPATHSSGEK